VSYAYDDDLRVRSEHVNGAFETAFGFDEDGLLTSAGAFSLARDAAPGRVTEAALAALVVGAAISVDIACEPATCATWWPPASLRPRR
jgi:hypothetical protein